MLSLSNILIILYICLFIIRIPITLKNHSHSKKSYKIIMLQGVNVILVSVLIVVIKSILVDVF